MRLAPYLESRLPTLDSSDPLSRFFEVHEGTLFFQEITAFLVLSHRGYWGLIPRDAMLQFLAKWEFDPVETLQHQGARVSILVYVLVAPTSPSPTSVQISTRTNGRLEQSVIQEWVG